MYYHIGQCTGVCTGKVSKEEYMGIIRDVMAFLEGKREELVERLIKQMEQAAENLEFEKAARIRDQVKSIQTLIARQKVVSTALEDQDVIAIVANEFNTIAEMFFIRGGKLIGQEHFMLENANDDDLAESLREFIQQYYDTAAYVPREILLNEDIDEMDLIEDWLLRKRGAKVNLVSPKRGEKKQLVEMARKNAELVLKQLKLKMETDSERIREQLESLQHALGMHTLPRRIEAYDVSNIQGQHTVASLVVFENGQPNKAKYRKFKIKTTEGVPDDYASIKEVISRRLTGSLRCTQAFDELPDLILIDGGKGQLSAALEVLENSKELEADSELPVVIGLAKRNEEIIKPGIAEPLLLPRSSKALHLLQRIRDEAHRFAVTYHRAMRGKAMRASVLNNIPGIGPRRKKALMSYFGTVERIKDATEDELAATPGMTRAAAKAVHAFFRNRDAAS